MAAVVSSLSLVARVTPLTRERHRRPHYPWPFFPGGGGPATCRCAPVFRRPATSASAPGLLHCPLTSPVDRRLDASPLRKACCPTSFLARLPPCGPSLRDPHLPSGVF